MFQGGDENGQLTDGVVEVKGNFARVTGNANSYRATGTHLTRFTGGAAQTIRFDYPNINNSRFQDLLVDAGSSVAINGAAVIRGGVDNYGSITVPASGSLQIIGSLTLRAGSTTTNSGSLTTR